MTGQEFKSVRLRDIELRALLNALDQNGPVPGEEIQFAVATDKLRRKLGEINYARNRRGEAML